MGENFFDQKLILAPMVRFGTLPSRLLALDYGADIVFAEEIVDRLFLRCHRYWNTKLQTYDFVIKENGQLNESDETVDEASNDFNSISNTTYLEDDIVFRTNPMIEASKLVFQLGTKDPDNAVLVSRKLVPQNCYYHNDFQHPKNSRLERYDGPIIAGIDLNMGCPKDYSIKAGIGSALLKSIAQNEVACNVLKALVNENKPKGIYTSCKIRVLPDLNTTLQTCHALQRTGIDAITVHGRTPDEKKSDTTKNRPDFIYEIGRSLSISVIANGGSNLISSRQDALNYARQCGTTSIMLARAAMKNLSVFNEHTVSRDAVIRNYIKYAISYDMTFVNTKYCLQQMFYHDGKSLEFQKLLKSQCMRDICQIWACEALKPNIEENLPNIDFSLVKKSHLKFKDSDLSVLYYDVHYDKRAWRCSEDLYIGNKGYSKFDFNNYKSTFANPKLALRDICAINKWPMPYYITHSTPDNRSFRAIVELHHVSISTVRWEKSKKIAQQSSAYAALYYAYSRANNN